MIQWLIAGAVVVGGWLLYRRPTPSHGIRASADGSAGRGGGPPADLKDALAPPPAPSYVRPLPPFPRLTPVPDGSPWLDLKWRLQDLSRREFRTYEEAAAAAQGLPNGGDRLFWVIWPPAAVQGLPFDGPYRIIREGDHLGA